MVNVSVLLGQKTVMLLGCDMHRSRVLYQAHQLSAAPLAHHACKIPTFSRLVIACSAWAVVASRVGRTKHISRLQQQPAKEAYLLLPPHLRESRPVLCRQVHRANQARPAAAVTVLKAVVALVATKTAAMLLLAARSALTTVEAKRAQTVRVGAGRVQLQALTQLLVLALPLPLQPHVRRRHQHQRHHQAHLKTAALAWREVVDLAVIRPAVALPRDA